MIASLLAEGRTRVAETLQKGYAPTYFSYNLELILVEDHRSPTSASMKSKIESTRERSARLQTLDSKTLIWWATAFPMRQWSGGRKMSSSIFDSLVRHAPAYAVQAQSLLTVVSADLDRLQIKHAGCSALQDFFENLSSELKADWEPLSADLSSLLEEGRYVNLSGVRHDSLIMLPDLLLCSIEGSRRYKEERRKTASISTALKIFLPTDPRKDDAYLLLPIGVNEAWSILHKLDIIS